MEDLIPRLIATIISVTIFTTLFKLSGWNEKLWKGINKKIKPQYNISLWIIMIVIINLLLEILFELNNIKYIEIFRGIILGFTFAIMPILSYKKSK
ncbi:MAG: hypothetical protein K0S61_3142 [Anaerocolumna sp.]|jgi:hypothetical protein|nr:hypothetical protein [Anaerocolumna sp.]